MNAKVKKVLNIILDVFIGIVLLISALVLALTISSKNDKDTNGLSVPSLFGYRFFSVQSDSMEPTIKTGDLIFSKKLSYSKPEGRDKIASLEVGDIITFKVIEYNANGEAQSVFFNTHKIIGYVDLTQRVFDTREAAASVDAVIVGYKTQGDNVATADEQPVEYENVIGIYSGSRMAGMGSVLNFLNPAGTKGAAGFICCIVVPIALLFIYQLVMFGKNFFEYNAEKARNAALEAAANAELSEEQKKKAIEEYLASVASGKEGESTQPNNENNTDEDIKS